MAIDGDGMDETCDEFSCIKIAGKCVVYTTTRQTVQKKNNNFPLMRPNLPRMSSSFGLKTIESPSKDMSGPSCN